MKRRLLTLALAALTIGFLGSCSKINERIDDIDSRVDSIEQEKIASIGQQIATINSSIADMETIRTNIQNLKNEQEAQGRDITALKAADITLEGKINDLKAYVDTELAKYATKDWATATFATLEQLETTEKALESLKETVDNLGDIDGALKNLKAELSDSIANAISSLAGRIKKLENAVDELKDKVDALEHRIQSVTIITAYNDGSLKAEDGILTINCVITPKEAVYGLKKNNFTILTSKSEVLTKSVIEKTFEIDKDEDLVLDKVNGTATIKVNVSSVLPTEEGKALIVAVNIKNGISDFTTEFVPVYVVPEGFVDLGVTTAKGKPLYWAKCNLGASKPEEYGTYFSWGDVTGQTPSESTFSKSFDWDNDVFGQNFTKVAQTTACPNGILAPAYDAATAANSSWRTPTSDEFVALAANCVLIWCDGETEKYNNTTVNGYIVYKAKSEEDKGKAKINGTWKKWGGSSYSSVNSAVTKSYSISDTHIFFPVAGRGEGTGFANGSLGAYWSSSLHTTNKDVAYCLAFNSGFVYPQGNGGRYLGFSVRPVKDAAPVQ